MKNIKGIAVGLLAAAMQYAPSLLAGETVVYAVAGQEYEGYYEPAEDSKGMVLIIHDWDGLTDYEVKRAEMLSDLGYSVFAADLYGKGVRPTETKDKIARSGELYKDREKMRSLMRGALAAASESGADVADAVAIGYCFGGTAILELARAGEPLKGFASFHGGLTTPEGQTYQETQAPVMVYHGSADTAVSMADFAALAEQLESHGVTHEMTTYSGAPHAFSVFGSSRYQEKADKESWASFTRFLDETLAP
ncbi:dienelactone hydrolase family protein [Congregibacter litoralis]|uniref:Dienelactone hydrolase n=1 Tax=Congregibacter litoralis KT71 TaxID=314285 RepID=A4A8D4_9GAMM|nr:dienelactone hydrolase family protein [Congregibacter litoralis]EAQ97929.1 Dienelactone hydrolase [Congregibacter litoralis KT71]